MKKHFIVLLFFIGVSVANLQAQLGNELSILPLLNEGESRYKELVEKNMTIARFEIDLVKQSFNRFAPVKLVSGRLYSVLLLGEYNVINEIELKINTNSNGSFVSVSDVKKSSRIIETTFKPDKNEYYEFEIIANKFSTGNKVGRYCLIIAYD
jgi:preprotein translocase subunit Sss1